MHARLLDLVQISLNGATEISVGPLNVELEGFSKSTRNRKRFKLPESAMPRNKLGSSTGGGFFRPDQTAGRLEMLHGSWKHTAVAAFPKSIWVRSKAHAIAPMNLFPPAKMLNDP